MTYECAGCGRLIPAHGTVAWWVKGHDSELFCSKLCARDNLNPDDYISKVMLTPREEQQREEAATKQEKAELEVALWREREAEKVEEV